MEKTKDKVAKAINARAEAKLNDAAQKLRRDINGFCEKYEAYDSEDRALILQALVDNLRGITPKWTLPKKVWNTARKQAWDEFQNQFDALTRFVNQDITPVDAQIQAPESS